MAKTVGRVIYCGALLFQPYNIQSKAACEPQVPDWDHGGI